MPDEKDGKLTQIEQDRALKWVNEHVTQQGLTCAVCKQKKWGIAPYVVSPPIFGGGSYMLGGTAYPFLMVQCSNCAHTLFVNAVSAGVFPPETEDGGKSE